ncbi:MAG TPA: hypothetical protein VIJ70_02370, partial [Gaiellaceae bacterium]
QPAGRHRGPTMTINHRSRTAKRRDPPRSPPPAPPSLPTTRIGGSGLRRTLALSIGVVAGAQLGARISLRLRGSVIQLLLAAALLALAARLLYTV